MAALPLVACLLLVSLCTRCAVADREWREQALEELRELERSIQTMENDGEADSLNDIDQACDGKRTAEVSRWVDKVDEELRVHSSRLSYLNWDYITNLTDYNQQKLEPEQNEFDDWFAGQVKQARKYLSEGEKICNNTATRLLTLMVHYSSVPHADNPATTKSIHHLVNTMEGIFSTVAITKEGKAYRLDPELTQIMAQSRDADELLWAWLGWRNATGQPIRPLFTELVRDMNEAARDNGYADVSQSWQMADFGVLNIEPKLDDLFREVKPFYELLHAYVRNKLREAYPNVDIDPKGPIPAHLLGNMWAQQWMSIFDLVVPYPNVPLVDVTQSMKRKGYTPSMMFHTAERFFTSLGLDRMTSQFWANSVITRPLDGTPMQCHGSAEDFMTDSDFRINMCTEVNAVDLQTIHHEMGHVEYFMAYRHQPALFRSGANAAFHEAIGDTIALSVATPTHLRAIGLADEKEEGLSKFDSYKQDINFLMLIALQKLSFLPFGYLVDKWRFAVFRGDIPPEKYNSEWWRMREKYQGLKAPVARSEEDFDPGSKYHIPSNVPYSRYFLSFIGQFQFHEALCRLAKHNGPLYKCDIYKSTDAGDRLKSVLSLGASKDWPEVMTLFTGQPEFKVDSMLQYFGPLISWLKRANRKSTIGWSADDEL